ncbi:MAG: heat-inducible transcriptional repressor [Actinomycetota bacterium]|jgi:heat-inducible transcriptional repressor|nr:heat-inducible transcriptional repressor [Actinomycetota bacterium]MEA2972675.1 heat-inducible transcriptional repressor [Actinomycetota bacterium]
MLDDRKAAILRAVVQEYIQTAQPVGSAHLARAHNLGVSPATVRNEMAVLEREGFLAHPHTSAGRIPTDKGYRFFVDNISVSTPHGVLEPAKKAQVQTFFARAHGQLEEMLHDTSCLLSSLTHYAAMVVAPQHEDATVRSVQIVGLGTRVALVVAVLSTGAIEKATLELDDTVGDEDLAVAAAHLNGHLVGFPITDDRTILPTGNAVADRLTAAARTGLVDRHSREAEQVYVDGASHMAATFEAVATVRQVLTILEQQYVVVSLLREALHDDRLNVVIGAEHRVESLAECSIIVAPYELDGGRVGTIGVLGPTRMNYPQAMAAVAAVSQRLGRALSEN